MDQVIHFFFDDHDFGPSDIGSALIDPAEVEAIAVVKHAIDQILTALPHGGDDDYVTHPLWPQVTQAAAAAVQRLGAP